VTNPGGEVDKNIALLDRTIALNNVKGGGGGENIVVEGLGKKKNQGEWKRKKNQKKNREIQLSS